MNYPAAEARISAIQERAGRLSRTVERQAERIGELERGQAVTDVQIQAIRADLRELSRKTGKLVWGAWALAGTFLIAGTTISAAILGRTG